MGLDISVYKVESIGSQDPDSIENYYELNDFPELKKQFSHLSFEKELTFNDIKGDLEKLGYNIDDLQCTSYGGSEEHPGAYVVNFKDTKHPLYNASEYLNEIWSKCYFNTMEELEKSDEYKKFKQEYLPELIKHGWVENYRFFVSGQGYWSFNLNNANHFCAKKIKVELINPSEYKKKETCIYTKEVGYQRKGANKQFYDDGMWNSKCILDIETLMDHWYKYFSDTKPLMDDFKKNIIDKQVVGETFVIYH